MPFDIVAFYESQAAADKDKVQCVTCLDDIYKTANTDDLYVKSRAPFLAAMLAAAITGSALELSEIRQPSLKVLYRNYEICSLSATTLERGILNLFSSPLPLYPEEKLNVIVTNAGTEVTAVFLWLASGKCTRAMMENVSPTHLITGYSDTNAAAGVWTYLPMTWDQDLPKGHYAIVGMRAAAYIAAGFGPYGVARLKLLDTTWRPGVVVNKAYGDKVATESRELSGFDALQRWPLMREISFGHDQMPNLEVLEGAVNTSHIVNLLLQKIA